VWSLSRLDWADDLPVLRTGSLVGDRCGRALNSRGGSSPGRATSVAVEQQSACFPALLPACGKPSDPPCPAETKTRPAQKTEATGKPLSTFGGIARSAAGICSLPA